MGLPNKLPFMGIEHEQALEIEGIGTIRVLAFGAYNARGLIGTEKGGVAIAHEEAAFVVGTKDIPWDPVGRLQEYEEVVAFLKSFKAEVEKDECPARILQQWLRDRGYQLRMDY
ncbi:MAG TPA: hypothetical protein ENH11_00045 [Candidatus Acetothermia bacterium]|nr:hypothetical protein [Candidatus Acetothermia bacterium]